MADHIRPRIKTKSAVSPQVLTEVEAARYISMSRSWLAQARMTGNPDAPPFLKIGRSVRYLIADLDQWLAERRFRAPNIRADQTSPSNWPAGE